MTASPLVLGPLVRYVGVDDATFWFEFDAPGTVEVRTSVGETGSARTWGVHGHHYALVALTSLPANTTIDYEVSFEGARVWPVDGRASIHTGDPDGPVTFAFGSCRRGDDYGDDSLQRIGADALAGLGTRMTGQDPSEWPQALLLLGDQVYADDPSPEILDRLHARRRAGDGPAGARGTDAENEICDFEEYSWLYHESWGVEPVRTLLASVPSCMILDDHDLRDDWNSSASWRADIETRPWWKDRVVGAFSSYWVYQHLGNLSPDELARDDLYEKVRAAGSDAEREKLLADFSLRVDDHPDTGRWSFFRDFGDTRLIMIDSRCSRNLDPDNRRMVDDVEWAWVRERALEGSPRHILFGSSLPFLMLPALHHLEQWNEAVAQGSWGKTMAKLGEKLRIDLDLEHWAAFGKSFEDMASLTRELSRSANPPASILWLSGDVHCSYVARADFGLGGRHVPATYQLTMSPFRNPLDLPIRAVNRLAIRKPVARLLARLARTAKVPPVDARWEAEAGPWFDNGVMLLTADGDSARVRVEHAHVDAVGRQTLTTTAEKTLTL
ncbi:alkaline phosphatase D family protein [Rhodococcoides kyotonense]|uniref:alkaline phosphatase D family protein n=1 Tax=Rhodococcoides kyotonense TaxID=398843 RepID=UPI001FEB7F89|nr:alkaline phosphatase D family protein [Rhodococcus kyotonensis]